MPLYVRASHFAALPFFCLDLDGLFDGLLYFDAVHHVAFQGSQNKLINGQLCLFAGVLLSFQEQNELVDVMLCSSPLISFQDQYGQFDVLLHRALAFFLQNQNCHLNFADVLASTVVACVLVLANA